jgi:hypothetical protein
MLQFFMCALSLAICFQGSVPRVALINSDCLNAVEKKQLSAEEKVDGRVKVYRGISERLHLSITSAIAKQRFDEVPALIRCWRELLTVSLKDIEANISRNKKSGALINYEIQVRKSIVDMDDARLKAPYAQQSDFEAWISQAQAAHGRFVDILFQR